MEQPIQGERAMKYVLWLTVSIPLLCLSLFYSFVLRARFELGNWPYPYHPDPKDLRFDFHYLLILVSFIAAFASPMLAVSMFFLSRKVFGKYRLQSILAIFLFMIVFASYLLVCRYDPGKFMEWYMD